MPDSGQVCLVLEYMDGGSLADVLKKVCCAVRMLRVLRGAACARARAPGRSSTLPPPLLPSMPPPFAPHTHTQPTQPTQHPTPHTKVGRVPEAVLSVIAACVLAGLASLHGRKMVHRDIKVCVLV